MSLPFLTLFANCTGTGSRAHVSLPFPVGAVPQYIPHHEGVPRLERQDNMLSWIVMAPKTVDEALRIICVALGLYMSVKHTRNTPVLPTSVRFTSFQNMFDLGGGVGSLGLTLGG